MQHGPVMQQPRAVVRVRVVSIVVALGGAAALALPAVASAAEAAGTKPATPVALVEPADGHHFDHLERAPMVQFDPAKDASGTVQAPKWVLLASDREMTKTVRYCRQFVWASAGGAFHWGCNRWATGVDQAGNDRLLALEPGTVYYWQVVSRGPDGTGEVRSAVRAFAIDAEASAPGVAGISGQVHGTAFDDGTQLNLGAAAFVNSGVRVSRIRSSRLAPRAFRIRLSHSGGVDYSRSYVKVTSAAGTRYLKVAKVGSSGAGTLWRLSAAERRLRTKRFTYQAYLRSTKNGAMVKSQARVVLIRSRRAPTVPGWTPDR